MKLLITIVAIFFIALIIAINVSSAFASWLRDSSAHDAGHWVHDFQEALNGSK